MTAAKKSPPEPSKLQVAVLAYCAQRNLVELAQEDIGKAFVREQEILRLLGDYEELRTITPKRSDMASTLESLLTTVVTKYVNHYFGKFVQVAVRTVYGKRAPTWNPYVGSGEADRLAVLVATLNMYADHVRAVDVTFIPPDPHALQGFVIQEHVLCMDDIHYAWGLVTRQWLHILARQLPHASREALRDALLRQVALDYVKQHPRSHLGQGLQEPFSCEALTVYDCQQQLEAALDVMQESAASHVASSIGTDEALLDEEEEAASFSFSIEITGCQAEGCTRSVEVEITREALLAWAKTSERIKRATRLAEVSSVVLDYLVNERGEAHLDDHGHDLEMDFDGQDQLRAMAQLIFATRSEHQEI